MPMGGVQTDLVPNISGDLKSRDKGIYTVQVYNYNCGVALNYEIWVTGLSAQPDWMPAMPQTAPVAATTAPPVATSVPAPAVPAPAAPVAPVAPAVPAADVTPAAPASDGSLSGRLAKGTKGHFDTFELTYPGDQSVYTINMQVFPDDAKVLKDVGFKVYDPTGKTVAQSGPQQSLRPNVSGNLISTVQGTFVVQVYNYDPDLDIDYTISLVIGPKEGTAALNPPQTHNRDHGPLTSQ